jgi:hypothetical protein
MLSLALIGLGLFTFAFLGLDLASQANCRDWQQGLTSMWPFLVVAAVALVEGTFLAMSEEAQSHDSRRGLH